MSGSVQDVGAAAGPRNGWSSPSRSATALGEGAALKPPSFTEYLTRSRTSALAVVLALSTMFGTVVLTPYGYGDDYPLLWMAVSGKSNPYFGSSILQVSSAGGRPIGGLLLQLACSAAGTIDNLRFIRLAGVLGIVALALLLQWALVRSQIPSAFAALIAIAVCSTPVFGVVASWAVSFTMPIAALLAGGASMAATSTLASPRAERLDRLGAACAGLFVALLIYQPAAMFFWVFLAVALVGAARHPGAPSRLVKVHALVAGAALMAAFVVSKLVAHLVHDTAAGVDRTGLTHDFVGKGRWFVEHPLYRSLSLFELRYSPWVTAAAIVLGLIAVAYWFVLGSAQPVWSSATSFALVPLSFLPNLVVKENNSLVFRTGFAMTSLVALYAALGIVAISVVARESLKDRLGGRALARTGRLGFAVSVALVAVIAYHASRNVTTLVAEPQYTELKLVRAHVAELPADSTRIGFVSISWYSGITPWYSDEIGLASSARPFVAAPEIYLILKEEGRLDPNRLPNVDTFAWNTTVFPQGEPVINMAPELYRLRG